MLQAQGRDNGDFGLDDIGGIQASAQAHLDHRDLDAFLGKQAEGQRGG